MIFDNSYLRLPKNFYSASHPLAFSKPSLIKVNSELAQYLGFNEKQYSAQELAEIFSGKKKLPGSEFISMVYAAHQFGQFVPILGDGRAILIGEVIAPNGKRYDLQLKGAGPTFYSRRGDGLSALGPVLREYLVSEFMHTVRIPTTRALAAVASGVDVCRENILPGGIFTRVAEGHVRIGTFQYFSAQKDSENLKILLQYCIERHYPEILYNNPNSKEIIINFLQKVIKAQVNLVSSWMSVGFIHGVMNTDNMSISGETLDYGPCAFMDHFNFNQVYSFIDRHGRYNYSNQAKILEWNLARLADTFILLLQSECSLNEKEAVALLENELHYIPEYFEIAFIIKFSEKLALDLLPSLTLQDKAELIAEFLEILHIKKIDFTLSFRELASALITHDIKEELSDFFEKWIKLLAHDNIDFKSAASKMNAVNPLYIPRNHLIEKMIKSAVEQSDFSLFFEMCDLLKNPFTENEKHSTYSRPPKRDEIVANTFCGT